MLYEVITMIPAPNNKMVPLSTLATVEYSGSIGDIVRINNERVVTVKANVDESKIPGPRITSYNVCYTKLLRNPRLGGQSMIT